MRIRQLFCESRRLVASRPSLTANSGRPVIPGRLTEVSSVTVGLEPARMSRRPRKGALRQALLQNGAVVGELLENLPFSVDAR